MFSARFYCITTLLLVLASQSHQSCASPTLQTTASTQDLYQLAIAIEEYLHEIYPLVAPYRGVRVTVKKPDSRLRLKHCDKDLTVAARKTPKQGGPLSVQVSCNTDKFWSIYIAALVEIEAPIVHSKRDLKRGHQLNKSDLAIKYSSLHKQGRGGIHTIEDAIGLELKRSLRAHSPLRQASLQAPNVVNRGDQVSVRAKMTGVEVVTYGTALSDGRLGKQIRIRNNSSEKIVKARITGPGTAEVIL